MSAPVLGERFRCEEHVAADVLDGLDSATICVNDPPWTALAATLHGVGHRTVVASGNMERVALDELVVAADAHDVVVGVGGGTALDTAKYLAWRLERPLLQIPTITSVDAAFTDAVGIREHGRVRYVGHIVPELVVVDIPLIRSAPPHLNRAGIGDVLSCHTGLFDWRLATSQPSTVDEPASPPWDDTLADLGHTVLDELDDAADEIAATSPDAIRFLAGAYQRIGAACSWAGHSRFEEGSEHFFAYAYEHLTRAHLVHGELITLAVCALAHLQGNDPQRARSIAGRARTRAHPGDLGIDRATFIRCLTDLHDYARSERLDVSIVDRRPVSHDDAVAVWDFVDQLPRDRDT